MMSENDVAGEVLERLEWHDSKQEQTPELKSRAVTRRVAIGGGAGALAAIMLSPVAQSFAASSASIFGPQKKLQVRVRQPRDDEPVLHADAERHRRRMRAARLHVTVDRLGVEQRPADGDRVQLGDHRRR